MLRMLADELGQTSSEHEDRIRRKLKIFLSHTGSISSLIFEDGTGYIDSGIAVSLTPEEKNFIRSLKESGVIEPTSIDQPGEELLYCIRRYIFRMDAGDICSRVTMWKTCTRNMLFLFIIILAFLTS